MVNRQNTQLKELLERQHALIRRHQKRLARKIHDDVSQKMTLLSLQLSLAATDTAPPADWAQNCQDWSDLVVDLGQAVRGVSTDLQPRVLEENGLRSALMWLSQLSGKGISCVVHSQKEDIFLPTYVGNELFTICRDIISDVLIPAKVPRADMELNQNEGTVTLSLSAPAGLINDPNFDKLLALLEVPERMSCIEGTAQLSRTAAGGLSVFLSVPVERLVCDTV